MGIQMLWELTIVLCTIFVPPLGVFLVVGLGFHFWLSIVLTLCGYFPGLVHGIWVLFTH